jgi:hypothetical protein
MGRGVCVVLFACACVRMYMCVCWNRLGTLGDRYTQSGTIVFFLR